jgi:hypothetical protein
MTRKNSEQLIDARDSRAQRMAERMAARLREAELRARAYEATLDPRQRMGNGIPVTA